jgi:integrase
MRGHIRQRSPKSWASVLDLGPDATGKRRQKWHTVRGGKKDAQRELARLLHEINTGAYVEPSRMTLSDYLDRWLDDYARPNVSAKTFERYEEIARLHLKPALGHHPLSKLQPLHIARYYSEALAYGRKDGRGGLSARSVLHHHRVLRAALHQAVKWLLLPRNPADAVEPPRPKHREMRALDEAATAKLLRSASDSRLSLPVLLAVTTGLRRGEILGLRWQDVDLHKSSLAVRQSLEQTRGGLAFKQPKTAKSRRVVALPALAVEALKQRKVEQATTRLALGPSYQDHDLVCPRDDGTPWPPDSFSSSFVGLVRRAGVPTIRFHDLRHTHATQLLRQGVHPKVVSERLGHATVGITLDVYSHVLPGMQAEAASRTDAALRAALTSEA